MKLKIYLLLFCMVILSVNFISADDFAQFHGIVPFSNESNVNTETGMRILINQNLLIVNVSKTTATTSATGMFATIRTGNITSGTLIGIANFSGNVATFDTPVLLSKGVNYFIGVQGVNSTNHTTQGNATGIFPNQTFVNWTARIDQEGTVITSQGMNSVTGISIQNISSVDIVANAPANNSQFLLGNNITFNASVTTTGFNVTNASLYIDGVINITQTITGDLNETIFIVNQTALGTHLWFIEACATSDECASTINRTYTVGNIEKVGETFNATTLETSRENFILTINTTEIIVSVDAILEYGIFNFTADVNCTGNQCTIRKDFDIPLINSSSVNNSFNWNITLFNGTTSINDFIIGDIQEVNRVRIEQCNATFPTMALNFTAFDEQNQTKVDPFDMESFFEIWLGQGSVKRNNSFSQNQITESNLCIDPNRTYFTDATIEYNKDNSTEYLTRNFFFQGNFISNVSQDIPLFLLDAGSSTSFILRVQSDALLPLADHLIEIQRFYPGEGEFKTVQIAKTDSNGQTVGFFETETVDYRFIIRTNQTVLLITEPRKIIPETSPFTLTFTIGVNLGKPWKLFEDLDSLTSTMVFNQTTNVVTYTYVDTSTNFSLGSLLVERQNFSLSTNSVICDVNSSLGSATLTCNLTGLSDGIYTARGFITRDGTTFLVQQLQLEVESSRAIVGNLGLILGWLIILVSAFTFKFNEIAGIILINIAIIAVNLFGLIYFGPVFITAVLAVSITIIVLLEK